MVTSWTDQIENGNGIGDFFLKIDDTFFLLIDDTHKLIIQDGFTLDWTDQIEN